MSIMYITVATTGCRKSQYREKPYFSSSVDENEEKMYTSLNARMHITHKMFLSLNPARL